MWVVDCAGDRSLNSYVIKINFALKKIGEGWKIAEVSYSSCYKKRFVKSDVKKIRHSPLRIETGRGFVTGVCEQAGSAGGAEPRCD